MAAYILYFKVRDGDRGRWACGEVVGECRASGGSSLHRPFRDSSSLPALGKRVGRGKEHLSNTYHVPAILIFMVTLKGRLVVFAETQKGPVMCTVTQLVNCGAKFKPRTVCC